jgi:hypothetical protein
VKDLLCSQFQETVADSLIRHKGVVDAMTKLQEAVARVNRAVAKAANNCGCIRIVAEKPVIPEEASLADVRGLIDTDVEGTICEHCRDVIETEVGSTLFYLTAVLNTVDLSLYDCLLKEHKRVKALGLFHFS